MFKPLPLRVMEPGRGPARLDALDRLELGVGGAGLGGFSDLHRRKCTREGRLGTVLEHRSWMQTKTTNKYAPLYCALGYEDARGVLAAPPFERKSRSACLARGRHAGVRNRGGYI